MAKRKIFISFDYTNDHRYKDLLVAWSKNTSIDFPFDDRLGKSSRMTLRGSRLF